jgi:acetyltransferase-like isoleucine patch superfamily enzyme
MKSHDPALNLYPGPIRALRVMTPSPSPPQNPFDRGYFHSEELRKLGFQSVGKNVQIARNCTIIGLENISIGNNVRIDDHVVIAAASGYVSIGNYIHIGGSCYLGAMGGITLSDFSNLSQGVRIYSGADDYSGKHLTNPTIPKKYLGLNIDPVNIGRHVIIGSGSVVLPGCNLAEGVSVGALSLVTKSLAAWAIYFGAPAKKLKSRSKDLLVLEEKFKEELARRK